MIVDCHTTIWDAGTQFGRARLPMVENAVLAEAARHLEAASPVDRAIVLGFKSRYLETEISNRCVADYVRKNSSKLVGFAGIDPTDVDCLEELRIAQEDLQLKGVTVSPALQNFHPADTRAMRLFEECARRGMPVLFESAHRNPAARVEFSRPMLLDEVAREFPQLRIVVAHLGYPFIDETLVLLGKHEHAYADVAALLRSPWRIYNALLAAHEYGVTGKLLFGSDFPHRSPAAGIEALYSINHLAHGTNLPTVPREQLRGIVERDTLGLLGIEQSRAASPEITKSRTMRLVEDES
jgi:hypothetical protein